jgi:hypothetical protein
MVKSPSEKQELVLFNYAALINSKEDLIQKKDEIKNWTDDGGFR